jgi:hypothetical protein
MDRDDNGIPDWMEDERYADERFEQPRNPGGFGGCGTVLPMLLGAATFAAALRRRWQR